MRKIKQVSRPYTVRYYRNGRWLYDAATSFDNAVQSVLAWVQKPGVDRAEVYNRGALVYYKDAA